MMQIAGRDWHIAERARRLRPRPYAIEEKDRPLIAAAISLGDWLARLGHVLPR